MIDLKLLRESPTKIIAILKKKDPAYDAQKLHDLDQKVRDIRQQVEELRHQKNELAQQAKSGITDEIRAQSIEVGKQLKGASAELEVLEQEFHDHYMHCPNLIYDDVPEGNKESNVVVKEHGTVPTFDFEVKNHVELGNALGWFDFERAAQIAGSNFALYKGDAVRLMHALTVMMLKHNHEHGFDLVFPPSLVNQKSLEVSSNFPKFKDQAYEVEKDGLYLTPTAEVDLANMYREQILEVKDLPVRMTAATSCFRREAGGYGATERGLIRIHQFEKVELFSICNPEKSGDELDRMVACAESLLQKLGLVYRVSLLAAQDTSFQSSKTYDLEVWLPGQKEFYEVSSASNCTDFQARRGLIRFREYPDAKPQLVHTLNASSLALPRLIVALMETYQQQDGSIALPEVLKAPQTLF